MAKVIYPSVELALALSGMSCENPIRPKRSRQAGSEIHRQTRQRESGAG
ncbi:hypothetical protein ACFL0M_15445 [Thermodesulfobacteriota bacterium]